MKSLVGAIVRNKICSAITAVSLMVAVGAAPVVFRDISKDCSPGACVCEGPFTFTIQYLGHCKLLIYECLATNDNCVIVKDSGGGQPCMSVTFCCFPGNATCSGTPSNCVTQTPGDGKCSYPSNNCQSVSATSNQTPAPTTCFT